ncbi:MAG: HNH endonuclease [bacterium]
MKFYVGVTDNSWFKYLAERNPDEVNFWRPSGKSFGAINTGYPFLFKLHSPLNFIAGGGFFVKSFKLPLSLAWDAFGKNNGSDNISQLRSLINNRRSESSFNPEIGCIILNQPFFLPRDKWIPVPENWSMNIVAGKTYDTSEIFGKRLWEQVQSRLQEMSIPEQESLIAEEGGRYGKDYLRKARLGQGAFRVLLTEAYQRSCAVTGERTLPVLQAAHIKPFSESGPNQISNGLLLRSDLHILFDNGYITITPDYHIEVSKRIKEEFDNGREYYPFHGQKLTILPEHKDEQPGEKFINWHNENVFVS